MSDLTTLQTYSMDNMANMNDNIFTDNTRASASQVALVVISVERGAELQTEEVAREINGRWFAHRLWRFLTFLSFNMGNSHLSPICSLRTQACGLDVCTTCRS